MVLKIIYKPFFKILHRLSHSKTKSGMKKIQNFPQPPLLRSMSSVKTLLEFITFYRCLAHYSMIKASIILLVFQSFMRFVILTHLTSFQGFTKKEFAIFLRFIVQIWSLWRNFLGLVTLSNHHSRST